MVDTSAPSPNTPIKVPLADGAQVIRQVIRQLLEDQPEVEVVGEAADFAQTIQMAKDLKPHVIVMDLYMPKDRHLDVKSHLNGASQLLAISFSNDDDEAELLSMPQESTNTEYRVTTPTEHQENQEDGSTVRDWKPSLKPSRMKGPGGIRSTCLFRAHQSERED
jgi:chemotaxis response regulator CheB